MRWLTGRVDRAAETWPSLTVQVELVPWHWYLKPRLWTDWDCTSSCSFDWLFVRLSWFANRPLFPPRPVKHGGKRA